MDSIDLTEETRRLFIDLVEDAPNWGGQPLFQQSGDASRRGNLTDLKKKGLVVTWADTENKNCTWVEFTPAGEELAQEMGYNHYLSVYRSQTDYDGASPSC